MQKPQICGVSQGNITGEITGYKMTELWQHMWKRLYIIDKLRVRMQNFIADKHEKIDDNNEKWGKHDKTNMWQWKI